LGAFSHGLSWDHRGMWSPIVQGKATRPGNVHAGSKEGRYDLPLDDGLFDDSLDFVLSDTTVPDRLSGRSANLKVVMIRGQLVPKMGDKISGEITEVRRRYSER